MNYKVIRIDPQLHKQLRVLAAKEDKTLKQLVDEIAAEALARRKPTQSPPKEDSD